MTQTVTALYDTYNFAVSAVNALEASGVPHSDISIVSNNIDNRYTKDRPARCRGSQEGRWHRSRSGRRRRSSNWPRPISNSGAGPVVAAGWLVATAAGAATGAVVGGAAGGLVGSLTGADVPERDAQFYAEGVRRGGTLVTADSMTLAHRQRERSFNAISRLTRSSVARHTAKAAGRPSTKTRRLTLRTKSQRSAHATSDNAASS